MRWLQQYKWTVSNRHNTVTWQSFRQIDSRRQRRDRAMRSSRRSRACNGSLMTNTNEVPHRGWHIMIALCVVREAISNSMQAKLQAADRSLRVGDRGLLCLPQRRHHATRAEAVATRDDCRNAIGAAYRQQANSALEQGSR